MLHIEIVKNQKVILLRNTLTFGSVLLGNYVALNICVNCSFLHVLTVTCRDWVVQGLWPI